jgi:hypothetical protein
VGRALGYRDAVVLLGGDPPLVAALDRALGSALKAATGGWSEPVLSLFDAKGRIVRLGRNLIRDLRERVRGTGRVDRTQRLEAAHVVIVVTAYFEALGSVQLPFSVRELRITRQEQLRLAGGSRTTQEFGQTLLTVTPPRPAAHLSYEHLIDELGQWYGWLSSQLIDFVRGLAVWDSLNAASRAETQRILGDKVCRDAVDRFQQLYGQLAGEIAEFGFWVGQLEHQATRVEVRRALGVWRRCSPRCHLAARPSTVSRACLPHTEQCCRGRFLPRATHQRASSCQPWKRAISIRTSEFVQ